MNKKIIPQIQNRSVICNTNGKAAVTIDYELSIKNVKNINLRIKADGKVYVSAAAHVPVTYIDDFVAAKADYILEAKQKFADRASKIQPARQYVTGEEFMVLGKKATLKVLCDRHEKAWFEQGVLTIAVRDDKDIKRKERLVKNWELEMEKHIFNKICTEIHVSYFSQLPFPTIKIKFMKSRWGSCHPKGIITLNSRLLAAPIKCIEYVVLHEFSHFIHPNHSKAFYAYVEERMPDWRERKELLNNFE